MSAISHLVHDTSLGISLQQLIGFLYTTVSFKNKSAAVSNTHVSQIKCYTSLPLVWEFLSSNPDKITQELHTPLITTDKNEQEHTSVCKRCPRETFSPQQ